MLNLFAPINRLGVGIHAYQTALALEKIGYEICLVPPFGRADFFPAVIKWLANRPRFSSEDPGLMIFDSAFLTQFSGKPRIGFAVFETSELSPIQAAAVGSCDIVFTPSEWGRLRLEAQGIRSFVVNEGIDPEVFGKTAVGVSGDRPVQFVHIGKWEERKGSAQVLRCFFRALENETAVLVMHCDNPFASKDFAGEMLRTWGFSSADGVMWRRMGLGVYLSHQTDSDLFLLYADADCGIFPSKGEGWGLPILECLASGTPVIAGCWSGQSEYLREMEFRDYFLRESFETTAVDHIWFHGDRGTWFESTDDELVSLIRKAHAEARTSGFGKSSPAFKRDRERALSFTWDRAAGQIKKIFDSLNLSC